MQKPMESAARKADAWGVEPGYTDALNRWHENPEGVGETLHALMGAPPDPGSIADSRPSPGPIRRVPSPSARAWGWAVQLYALRSKASWGMGDLADLRELGAWSRRLGVGFIQINPLHAVQVAPPVEASPYYPSSRRFLNPLYLRIEEVPGAEEAGPALDALAAQGRSLNRSDLIDRDEICRLKLAALEILWSRRADARPDPSDPGFAGFAAEAGPGLRQFAAYCALAERHGSDWRKWPAEFRHPGSPAVARFAEEHAAGRLAFHQWVQWLLDAQLERASRDLPLIQDLPIGFDPGGADAWAWQDLLAFGASIGAPPDEFNHLGQDWGLPPFIPHRLRTAGYAPFRETLRAVLRHAGGLRVDHVMGLFRLYWVPQGAPASQGAYVRYAHEEMLAVVAEECSRVGAFVIGEDLGTVEPLVRESLARWGILGSKVLWFESDPPAAFPEATLASVSTHDLPTLAGLWNRRDAEEQAAFGLPVDPEAMRPTLEKIRLRSGLRWESPAPEVARQVHRMLAGAASVLIAATLDDALGAERRPNLPGSGLERPNWKIPLPKTLEEIERDAVVLDVARLLDRRL